MVCYEYYIWSVKILPVMNMVYYELISYEQVCYEWSGLNGHCNL